MDGNTSFNVGVGAGILCGVLLLAVMVFVKKKKGIHEFDERQIAARGKSFKYGFFAFLIYFSCFAVFQEVTGEGFIDDFTGMLIGICMAVTVFAANAIWNGAYLSLQENVKKYIIIFSSTAALNLLLCLKFVIHRQSPVPYITNLVCGIMLLLLVLTLVLKNYKDRKQEEAE